MAQQRILDFGGADAIAGALDQVVIAALIPVVAIAVAPGQIAGAQPLTTAQPVRHAKIAPISQKQRAVVVSRGDFADLAVWHRVTRVVDQIDHTPRIGPPHRARPHGIQRTTIADQVVEFGQAVKFVTDDAQRLIQPANDLAGQAFAACANHP